MHLYKMQIKRYPDTELFSIPYQGNKQMRLQNSQLISE